MGEGLKGYTTKIAAKRTAGEITEMLGEAGAGEVMTTYTGGKPVGVKFTLDVDGRKQAFVLPVNVAGVTATLRAQVQSGVIRPPGGGINRAMLLSAEHGERVAWRIAYDWLDAMLAVVQAGLMTISEVMFSRMLIAPDETVFQRFEAHGLPMLTTGDVS